MTLSESSPSTTPINIQTTYQIIWGLQQCLSDKEKKNRHNKSHV